MPPAQAFMKAESVIDSTRYNRALPMSHQYDSDNSKSDDSTACTRANNIQSSPSKPTKSSIKKSNDRAKRSNGPKRKLRFSAYDDGKSALRVMITRPSCPSFLLAAVVGLWSDTHFSRKSVLEIPHINDLSPEEIFDCWMTPEESQSIREECLGTVAENDKKMTDGMLLRGLDQHTNRYKEARDFISRQVYDAIFSVQEFEQENGVDCSELMAQLSAKYSAPATIAAQSAAISDLFSSFKGTWSHRNIPTVPDGPPESGTWETMTETPRDR
jgi:hypothetical protein